MALDSLSNIFEQDTKSVIYTRPAITERVAQTKQPSLPPHTQSLSFLPLSASDGKEQVRHSTVGHTLLQSPVPS